MKTSIMRQLFLAATLLMQSLFFVLPAAAAAAAESNYQTLTGWLTIIWGDSYPGSGATAVLYTLTEENGQETTLLFSEDLLRSHGGSISLNRQYIQVKIKVTPTTSALKKTDALEVTSLNVLPPPQSDAAALVNKVAPLVSGSQPWVSIMCKFSDQAAEPKDLAYFQNMYADVKPGLGHYWREQSYNQVNLLGSNAFGWFTLPYSESYYNPSDTLGGTDLSLLRTDCLNAADASVDFSAYSGINMMFNTDFDNGYAWGGWAYFALDGSGKLWRVTWEPPWGYSNVTVMAHEMGHGFGLPHSSGTYGMTYDNTWDVMSDAWEHCWGVGYDATYGCLGQHTIAYHKNILGWIPDDQRYLITSGCGTLMLDHLALASTNHDRMLQIPIAESDTNFYTVEVRALSGYDSKLPGKAVIIHEVDTTRSRSAQVIDADGNGETGDAGAMWTVGETFTDAANEITIHILAETATGFQITYTTLCDENILPALLFFNANIN